MGELWRRALKVGRPGDGRNARGAAKKMECIRPFVVCEFQFNLPNGLGFTQQRQTRPGIWIRGRIVQRQQPVPPAFEGYSPEDPPPIQAPRRRASLAPGRALLPSDLSGKQNPSLTGRCLADRDAALSPVSLRPLRSNGR